MTLAALVMLSRPARLSAQAGRPATAVVRVRLQRAGRQIPNDFLGFSYEAPVLTRNVFNPQNRELIRLLHQLGGGTLRFGGNSVEFTGWSGSGEARMAGQRAVVTPADLNRLFAFSAEARWPVILGLNLGQDNPTLFADEAAYAVRHGGRHLLALEIGNEPDLFMHNGLRPRNWDYANFRREWEAYARAIRARAPQAPISGPATCCAAGWRWFPRFVADERSKIVFATYHIYPMSAAPNVPESSPHYASIANMLSPELMRRVADKVHRLVRVAKSQGLLLRIAETNSASDGGKNGVSNVFAAALWGADYSFTLAEQGAAGLNFHGGFACRGYTAICRSGGHYVAQPLYYGMLLFHAAMPGRMVPVHVRAFGNFAAHAVLNDNGNLSLVLINKDTHQPMVARISGLGSYARATVLRLVAPSLRARTGITFAGHVMNAAGNWEPGAGQMIYRHGRTFQVSLPAASALLARFEK